MGAPGVKPGKQMLSIMMQISSVLGLGGQDTQIRGYRVQAIDLGPPPP